MVVTTVLILVAFEVTLARLQAECEATKAAIYGDYSVPGCYWDYDPTDMVMSTPAFTSRYPAAEDFVRAAWELMKE